MFKENIKLAAGPVANCQTVSGNISIAMINLKEKQKWRFRIVTGIGAIIVSLIQGWTVNEGRLKLDIYSMMAIFFSMYVIYLFWELKKVKNNKIEDQEI